MVLKSGHEEGTAIDRILGPRDPVGVFVPRQAQLGATEAMNALEYAAQPGPRRALHHLRQRLVVSRTQGTVLGDDEGVDHSGGEAGQGMPDARLSQDTRIQGAGGHEGYGGKDTESGEGQQHPGMANAASEQPINEVQ